MYLYLCNPKKNAEQNYEIINFLIEQYIPPNPSKILLKIFHM